MDVYLRKYFVFNKKLTIMGDIGNAANGGFNMLGTMYAAERNLQGVRETNDANLQVHREDNQFNANESAITRGYNTSERVASQDFNAQQADLNRQFQSSEADKARQFQIESIGKTADAYQRLGINPSGSMSGFSSAGPSPSGSMASSSPASASAASASPFAGFMAPHFENPIASFIDAFQSAQRTRDEHNMSKIEREYNTTRNQFQTRHELLSLRQQNAEIQSKLADADVSREEKENLKGVRRINDLHIKYLEDTLVDRTQMTHEENLKAANENKALVQKYAMDQIQLEWMPRLLSSQYNLTESQAKAVMISANAAMKSALAVEYDSKTHRMVYKLDERKYEEVLKTNYEEQTKLFQKQQDAASASADESTAQADYVRQKPALEQKGMTTQLLSTLINSVSNEAKSVVHAIGGTLILKGSPKSSKPSTKSYTDDLNPYTTSSTDWYVPRKY